MRLLHTSDWHLGRSFHGVGMLAAQEQYLDHLVETVAAEQIDAVLVSGDIYDRALPSVDAVALADDALARLAASRARVVLTSGNHDSGRRLGFSSRLIDAAGVHIRTSYGDVGSPIVLEDQHGEVAIHALPFIDPDIAKPVWELPGRSHHAALAEAMKRVRTSLDQHRHRRSVVMAHAFIAGGQSSDSERDIAVGGISIAPASLFDEITYTALGHLHRPQLVTESVRYSGSPLAYSFSEDNQVKGSWIVDIGASAHAPDVEFIAAPVPRSVVRLQGTLEELMSDPAHRPHEHSWVQATLTDAIRPREAMATLQRRFPHALSLIFQPEGATAVRPSAQVSGRTDHQIALDFVADLRGTPATEAEARLLQQAVESCCDDRELSAADVVVSR